MRKSIAKLLSGVLISSAIVLSANCASVTALAAPKVIPYQTVQAEFNFGTSGVELKSEGNVKFLSGLEAGDYVKVKDVDFSSGLSSLSVNVRSEGASLIEIRLDSVDGTCIGSAKINKTNGEFKLVSAKVSNVEGKHDIYFVGVVGNADFDYWTATAKTEVVTPEPEPTVEAPVVDPYSTVEAESATELIRLQTRTENGVTYVADVVPATLIVTKNVVFDGSAAFALTFRTNEPSIIEVRDGGNAGEKLATLRLSNTNGEFVTDYFQFPDLTGSKNLFFVSKFGKTDVDSWKVLKAPVKPNPENPNPEDPTPVDPEPVDPSPVDPEPVDPVASDLSLEYTINSWGTGYTINFTVVNNSTSAADSWKLKIAKSDITIDSCWCASVSSEGDYYVITPDAWNAAISAGGSAFFGIQGSGAIGSSISYVIE